MMEDKTINGVRQYCSRCYSDAAKHGRVVRQVEGFEYPICQLCESREREGLIHYHPSNGTEFYIFQDRCERCRHFSGEVHDIAVKSCAWGVLDKLLNGQFSEIDSMNFWFDPSDIDADTCPATCRRFTSKDDNMGHFRDPPPPDCVGQLTLDEMLEAVKPVFSEQGAA